MCMADGADDRPSVSNDRFSRSRKERKCDECGRGIAVGEMYRNIFMVCETTPFTFYTCEHCVTAQSWLSQNCGGYLCAGVYEDIDEHVQEYRRKEYASVWIGIARLKIGMGRQWRRFDGAGLMPVQHVPAVIEDAHV